jgi:hypothetical protein
MRDVAPGAAGLSLFQEYLEPMPIAGEALRFDLSAYRSTVTRQMAQLRVRVTRRAFLLDHALVAANLAADGNELEVDAGALSSANETVRRRLAQGPDWVVLHLRSFLGDRQLLDQMARTIGSRLARGVVPPPESMAAYVLTSAHYQELGALKFCLPDTVRPRVRTLVGDADLVDALFAHDGPTLWAERRGRELALARLRRHGPAERYRRRLQRYQREYGYLYAEDVDFRDHETLDALDARIATIENLDRRPLKSALAGDRARKCEARRRFAEAASEPLLVAHVLLARALAEHEDLNRRAKMRLLRDLRDCAEIAGLDIVADGLEALVSAEALVLPSR